MRIRECNQTSLWNLIEQIAELLQIEPESPASVQNALDEVLDQKPVNFEPLSYAVLSYVLDRNHKFALLKDSHYKKIQPPGRRLNPYEQPHEIALWIANRELDLSVEELKRFPDFREIYYGDTRVIAPPYQVQLETNLHREALAHYD